MKRVITFGVFDYFHYGHLKLFEKVKAISGADYLIVAVQDADFILKFKPQAQVLYTTEQRVELVKSLRIVDEVVVYDEAGKFIKTIDFDAFVMGEDQNNESFQEAERYAKSIGKEVYRATRTKGISSTDIKAKLKELS